MEEKNYEAIVEAILFTMGESVELEKIAAALELDKKETKKIIENLMKEYEKPSIGMKIIDIPMRRMWTGIQTIWTDWCGKLQGRISLN